MPPELFVNESDSQYHWVRDPVTDLRILVKTKEFRPAAVALDRETLLRRLSGSGTDHSLSAGERELAGTLMEGVCLKWRFPSDVSVHVTDGVARQDFEARVMLPPTVCVMVMLKGVLDAHFEHRALSLRAEREPCAALWTLTEPTALRRRSEAGVWVRKVMVSVPPSWFTHLPALTGIEGEDATPVQASHLHLDSWRPAQDLVVSAERLLAAAVQDDVASRIAVNRAALDILLSAL